MGVPMKKPPMGGRGGVRGRPSAALPTLVGGEALGHASTGSGLLSQVLVGTDACEGGEDDEEASDVVASGAGVVGHGRVLIVPLSYRHPTPTARGLGHFADWPKARGSSTGVLPWFILSASTSERSLHQSQGPLR